MKKIGIITLNGYFNYGNRLQNYALQEILKQHNLQCETIINKTFLSSEVESEYRNKYEEFKKKTFKQKLSIIYRKVNYGKINNLRTEIFKEFSNEYINETAFSISLNNIPDDLNNSYDYFIAGSDQVWNPNDPMVSEVNFLTFADKNKRLAYAPSFGVSSLPEKYKNDYKKWLKGIPKISVREEEGAKIVKELTGKDAVVLVDPTMMLSKEKWLSISKKHHNKLNGKYLLTYFLGGISKEINLKLKEIAKRNNLEIVNLANINDKKYYVTGPSEFIDYINDAELFITDSFHGCVFSVLLETPFVVCERIGQGHNKMNSRIETFLKKFKLQSRKFDEITDTILFEKNYIETNKILIKERVKVQNYLKDILSV